MKAFIRDNLLIVISIALPLLVIILFALASIIPNLMATPPKYDLLLSLHDRAVPNSSQIRYNFVVKDGQLKADLSKLDKTNYQGNPRLFLYQHTSGVVKEIGFQIPADLGDFSDRTEVDVPEFIGRKLSSVLLAPDGYEFRGRRSGGGMMTELFGGRRNRTDISIVNGGAAVRLRLPDTDYWYNNVRFVAWVVE
jgi:hypothetical protein